jgi:ribosomal protein S13
VREAEEIFKQVLERDPENEAALRGLEAIGRRRAQKITAADLLADAHEEVRGLTARKIQLLQHYLRTLRRGAASDVPGTAQ